VIHRLYCSKINRIIWDLKLVLRIYMSIQSISFLEAAGCFVVIKIIHIYKSLLTALENLIYLSRIKKETLISGLLRIYIQMSVSRIYWGKALSLS